MRVVPKKVTPPKPKHRTIADPDTNEIPWFFGSMEEELIKLGLIPSKEVK